MLEEFKKFAFRGNVIDLAVAVVIGGAFGKIVSALVEDILMPLIGILVGGISFENLKLVISPAEGEMAEVALRYGTFIQSTVDFFIIAFSIFLVIKLITRRKKEQEPEPAPVPEPQVILLEEIRDLLKADKS